MNFVFFILCQIRNKILFFLTPPCAFIQKVCPCLTSSNIPSQLLPQLFLLLHLFDPENHKDMFEEETTLQNNLAVENTCTIIESCRDFLLLSQICQLRIIDIAKKGPFYVQILISNDNYWDYNVYKVCVTYSIQMKRGVRKYLRISITCTHKALYCM